MGVGGEGVGDILVIKMTKKGGWEDLGFGALEGSLFLEFLSLLDSLVVCMCCCNPSPFPHVSLMYINPDSRGQCVLGEVNSSPPNQ